MKTTVLILFMIYIVTAICPDDCIGSIRINYQSIEIFYSVASGTRIAYCEAPMGKYISIRIKSLTEGENVYNFRFTSDSGDPPTICPIQRLYSQEDFQDTIADSEEKYFQFYTDQSTLYLALAPYLSCQNSGNPCYHEIEVVGHCDMECIAPMFCQDTQCICPSNACEPPCGNVCLESQTCQDNICLDEVLQNSKNEKINTTNIWIWLGTITCIVLILILIYYIIIRTRKKQKKIYIKTMTLSTSTSFPFHSSAAI